MIERLGNLWTEEADAKCITTNGFLKKNNALVMGAGVAGQAQVRYPTLPHHWGILLFSYPVKHKWFEKADLELIERSAHELMKYVERMELKKVLLPLPGCGNGQLSWTDVRPVLVPILDDRVHLISNSRSKDFNPPDDSNYYS